jgi:hypothetical protein
MKVARSVYFLQKIYRYKEENNIVSSGNVLVLSMIKKLSILRNVTGEEMHPEWRLPAQHVSSQKN